MVQDFGKMVQMVMRNNNVSKSHLLRVSPEALIENYTVYQKSHRNAWEGLVVKLKLWLHFTSKHVGLQETTITKAYWNCDKVLTVKKHRKKGVRINMFLNSNRGFTQTFYTVHKNPPS